jgi:hypothetical protein
VREATPYKVGVDQGVNLKKLRRIQDAGIVILYQAHDLEQHFRRVVQQGRPFQLGRSTLGGPDMLADEKLQDVLRELGQGHEVDAEHLYACYLNRNDYFLTENPDDFINGGRRERLEVLLGVRIRRTEEFLDELRTAGISVD